MRGSAHTRLTTVGSLFRSSLLVARHLSPGGFAPFVNLPASAGALAELYEKQRALTAFQIDQFLDTRHVFRYVDAYRIVRHFRYAHLPAIFEPAQLLELFDALKLALRQRGVFEQGLAPENIEPQMLQVPHLNFASRIARSEEHTSELQSQSHLVC